MREKIRRRSRLELYRDIIRTAQTTHIPTRIHMTANIQYNHFKVLLPKLVEMGFLTVTGDKLKSIEATAEGIAWALKISKELERIET